MIRQATDTLQRNGFPAQPAIDRDLLQTIAMNVILVSDKPVLLKQPPDDRLLYPAFGKKWHG
jgi:hypothetical protein